VDIELGNCIFIGSLSVDLSRISEPQKLKLDVSVENSSFRNSWDFWVYPTSQELSAGKVMIVSKIDITAERTLKNGGSVLFLTDGNVAKEAGAKVAIGFSSIFWNTAWTNNQPPHTLGILCNPDHPLFKEFPTENHSNWQWWDPIKHSQAMILDDLPANMV